VAESPMGSGGHVAPKWEQVALETLRTRIRKFAGPLRELVERDANEGDTRLLVTDMLCDALGYDKYEDLTTEYAVRGEFADYGVRIDKQMVAFVEVKRAAQNLKAAHLRQVETYAVKEGIEWIILTNGPVWRAYHVEAATGAPVETHLVLDVDLLDGSTVGDKAGQLLYLHKSAMKRERIAELWRQKAATAPAALVAVLLSETVLDAARKEVRRRSGYNPDLQSLANTIRGEVVRGDLL